MARRALALAALATLLSTGAAAQQTDCAALLQAKLADAKIRSAEWIDAAPGRPWRSERTLFAAAKVERPFCRVTGQATPVPGSDIRFELWLAPKNVWNGRFFGTAPPAPTGTIAPTTLVNPLNRGYAAMTHDNGHVSAALADTGWAVDASGKPDRIRLADYGWRAQHAATLAGKAIATLYYGKAPARAFFLGCGLPGHHGVMAAQRFPTDYDGVVAGAQAGDLTGMLAAQRWTQRVLTEGRLSKEMLQAIGQRTRAACDGLDGAADGQIEDPRRCPVDAGLDNLDPEQRDAAVRLRQGPPGGYATVPGSEASLAAAAPAVAAGAELLQRLETERDAGKELNAGPLDLRAFGQRGGKLILYHGWADPVSSPLATLAAWQALAAANASAAQFARLFLVPGMGHCSGGPIGASDWLTAIEGWVERNVPPELGTSNAVVGSGSAEGQLRQRVLCPFPQAARYLGKGDINADGNFRCVAPPA